MAFKMRFCRARPSWLGIGLDGAQAGREIQAEGYAGRLHLRFEQLQAVAHQIVQVHGFQLRVRHLGEVAEAPHDAAQFPQFGEQRGRALAEHLVELLGMRGARAL